MLFLKPSSYFLDELIENWKIKYPKAEIIPNTIFNLAYNNKLTLHVNKISWPYRIWADRQTYINDEIGFCSDYPTLYLVEKGDFSLYDIEIATYKRWLITDESAINSIKADRFFSDKESLDDTEEAIKKRKNELMESEYELNNHTTNDAFLTLYISDFEEFRDNRKIKDGYYIESKILTAPYKTIETSNLDSYDLDAKDCIAEQFNNPIHEYMHKESSITTQLLKNGNTSPRWTEEEKENGFNCPLERPGVQVQVDYTTKIDEKKILIYREDKENAEIFLDDFFNEADKQQTQDDVKSILPDHSNKLDTPKKNKEITNSISFSDKKRIKVVQALNIKVLIALEKNNVSPVYDNNKLVLPLTNEEAIEMILSIDKKPFEGLKNIEDTKKELNSRTFWRASSCKLAYSRERKSDKFKLIRKIIISI